MKPQDVLSYKVDICGPGVFKLGIIFRIPACCYVVGKCIKPDVKYMLRVIGYRNTPGKSCTAYTKVPQAPLYKTHNFVEPVLWADKPWIFPVKFKQPVLVGREFEKIALLFNFVYFGPFVLGKLVNFLKLGLRDK